MQGFSPCTNLIKICQLGADIFIIDQHASHEIYNFEKLQETTILKCQQLLSPIPLQLACEDEMIAMENLDVFKRNGFALQFNQGSNHFNFCMVTVTPLDSSPGNRLQMTTHPFSKKTTFGIADVYELVALIKASGGVQHVTKTLRPSGITRMFASRACRKSIMIGDTLSLPQMQQVCFLSS